MPDLRTPTHAAALSAVRSAVPLDALVPRPHRRRLVRDATEWYFAEHAGGVARGGTCVVVTAGPPGAGKSTIMSSAIPDLASRLVVDPDIAKAFLARWCVEHGIYSDILGSMLPDGQRMMPLELSPLLHTVSTEVANAVRREAFSAHMNVVAAATIASPGYGQRLLLSLAKAAYTALVIVSVETDKTTAQTRAIQRWWTGRTDGSYLGGRLVDPDVIDAAYPADGSPSLCRTNAKALADHIKAGETWIDTVHFVEYNL